VEAGTRIWNPGPNSREGLRKMDYGRYYGIRLDYLPDNPSSSESRNGNSNGNLPGTLSVSPNILIFYRYYQLQLLVFRSTLPIFRTLKSPSLWRFRQTLFAVSEILHFVFKKNSHKDESYVKCIQKSFDTEIWWHLRYLSQTQRGK
jgi:hypothetical protein